MSFSIKDVVFPIYYIGTHERTYSEFNVDYVVCNGIDYILDNKNLEGKTLGARRMSLDSKYKYHFKKTLFMFSELIEFTRTKLVANRKFMDSRGFLFNYTKTEYRPLKHFNIRKAQKNVNYTLISVEDSPQVFSIPNNYWNPEYNYLSALNLGTYYCLYDMSIDKPKSIRRKI